ncbi:MAG: hypothetical protein IJS57_01420 [Paludibacteraceae bacterium]|nr:hypothetical protein [Paludibacteraceae bacterium]
MKKHLKLALLVALFAGYCIPSWGQASTQGKEFWVALGLSDNASSSGSKKYYPFIAISTREACDVTISNPYTGWKETKHLDANVWAVARTNPTNEQKQESGYMFEIPEAQWYPQDAKEGNYARANEKAGYNLGLMVTSTKDVSVFAALRQEFAYDASNILPSNTLQYDYITQDYPPSQSNSYITILATENDTKVYYTLGGNTKQSGHDKGTTQEVTLSKGQVWYIVSRDETESLSGTHITADKKIAVFNGNVFTRVPGAKSARDCLYEQAMPTDYWGTEFVVTRSLKKDANRIRITAMENGTSIEIDDQAITALNACETFEFEMSDNMGTLGAFSGIAHYIKTSCPVAVYSYDVSSQYTASTSETDSNFPGDPSMVWIAPLEQHINEITFGACGTKIISDEGQTPLHYVNIVCLTANTASFKLRSEKQDIPVTFTPVPGNTLYSYARTFLVNTNDKNPDQVFTMSCPSGLIAQIYGNGKNESYAYSVGSSAVSLGTITVGDQVFQDGDVAKKSLCINEELLFDATAGTTIIDKVEWDFGDGITETITAPNRIHKYTSPGWYDVKARLYAHKDCPATTYPPFDVHFRFYVNRPDTIRHTDSDCVAEDYTGEMVVLDTMTYGCDSVVITQKFLHRKSSYEYSVTAEDAYTLRDSTYTTSTDVTWTTRNSNNCDSTITCHIQIVKCLNMQIENKPDQQFTCAGQNMEIPFSYSRDGGYLNAYLYKVIQDPTSPLGYRLIDKTQVTIEKKGESEGRKHGLISLPVNTWRPGYYVGCIQMEDANCKIIEGGIEQPAIEQSTALNLTIKYPENIIAFKFNNVLAVYQSGFGGNKGYDFVAYQWYRNNEKIDALKNPSAATSIYHSEEIFTSGDEYYVVLTESGKDPLASCSFTVPDDLDDYDVKKDTTTQEYHEDNTANKKMIDNRICVEIEGRIYDMYGQRVK